MGGLSGGWRPEVRAGLEEALERLAELPEPERVVAVDFDNTCIRNDIGEALFTRLALSLDLPLGPAVLATVPPELGRERLRCALEALGPRGARDPEHPEAAVARHLVLAAYPGLLERHGRRRAYAFAVTVLGGLSVQEVGRAALGTLAEGLRTPVDVDVLEPPPGLDAPKVSLNRGLRLYGEMRAFLRAAGERGARVVVVSASAQAAVRPVASLCLGIGPAEVIGMRTPLDTEGRLLPEMEEPLTYGPGKVQALREQLGLRPALAAGDAGTDLELLAAARLGALVVDRGDADLRAAARRSGWWLQPAGDLSPLDRVPGAGRTP